MANRLSISTHDGRAKCLKCRTRIATRLFSLRIPLRARCEACAADVTSELPEVDAKGFYVTEQNMGGWVSRTYRPATLAINRRM